MSGHGIDQEHEKLHEEIDALRAWWQECREIGSPRFDEMGDRVDALRTRLREHFAWEEEDGYLSDVLEDAPHLVKRGESLRRQHDTLLEAFAGLVEHLHSDEPRFSGWDEAGHDLDELLERLSKHEHAETELVLEAVQSDVGTKD